MGNGEVGIAEVNGASSHRGFFQVYNSNNWTGMPSVFHHFPITENCDSTKCRQFSVLGFARGSLGSFYIAIIRRPRVYKRNKSASRPQAASRRKGHALVGVRTSRITTTTRC
jgi:hypothetical protein